MQDLPSDDRDLDGLAAMGTIRSYPKNTLLIQEGDRTNQIYVVISGRLKVFLSDGDGKEMIIDMLKARDYFGEFSFAGEPRAASVMTMEPCKLAVLDPEEFKKFLASNPEAAFNLILTLIRRARNLTRSVGGLALLDVYGRVARLLLDNAGDEDGRLIVGERMTQQEISKRVNASREMVSRILADLREGEYIGIEGNRIVILRPLPARW